MSKIDWREYKGLKPDAKEREMFLMIRDIKDGLYDLKISNRKEHCELSEHAIKTNGRVTKNEKWRYMMVGAIILLGVLLPYLEFIK